MYDIDRYMNQTWSAGGRIETAYGVEVVQHVLVGHVEPAAVGGPAAGGGEGREEGGLEVGVGLPLDVIRTARTLKETSGQKIRTENKKGHQ